jgi:DNA-binding MarR family transcriptional regulator
MNAPTNQHAQPRDEALAQLGTAFQAAIAANRRLRGRDTHPPGELSFAQYHHLRSGLTKCDELPAGELALATDQSPATVTQTLDSLAEMGLIERTRSGRDRRVVNCTLTTRGRELLREQHAQPEQRRQTALAEFNTQDLATAAAVLDHLQARYDDLSTDIRVEA